MFVPPVSECQKNKLLFVECKNRGEEWFRQSIDAIDDAEQFKSDIGGPSVIFFHGTTAECAMRIIDGGAFIPGENGHTKGKTHFKGCFLGSRR